LCAPRTSDILKPLSVNLLVTLTPLRHHLPVLLAFQDWQSSAKLGARGGIDSPRHQGRFKYMRVKIGRFI